MTESRRSAPSWGPARQGIGRGITGGLLAVVVAASAPVFPVRAEARAPEPTPLDLVVLVDESASLATADVREEIQGAAIIAQSGLNPRTRVTVLGFGSDNGPGQEAVTRYCEPTVVATAERLQYLSDCVKKLHRRTEAEGSDTDHVAALSEALRILRSRSPHNSLKTVFLLTDGRMDVSDSPSYGPGDRNAEARRRLGEQIRTARREDVRIWPLGFGPEVDQASLNRFAAGGAQRGCDQRAGSRPRARRVRDSRQVARSLAETYAAASCLRVSPPSQGELRPGGTAELPLDIPGIASEATLTVAKGDRRVRVEFIDPDGRPAPANETRGRSRFTRSGADGTIEALRVTGPLNGRWRIRMTAPAGVGALPIGATAMYQGLIRSRLVADPPAVQTGEQAIVRLSLVTRRGYVQNPEELQGLSFTVTATGKGVGDGRPVEMRDDGQAPDDAPGDGSYAGTFTAPGTAGRVTLTGRVAGAGLRSTGNPTATVDVTARPPDIQGVVTFPDGRTAHPESTVHGSIRLHNSTSRAVRGRLDLRAPPQAQATVTPGSPLTIPPGGSSHPFAISFGGQAALGRAPVTVRMTSETDQDEVYLNKQTTMTVEKAPGWAEQNLRQIIFGLALVALVLAALLLKRCVRRGRADVRSLRVVARRNGEQTGAELRPQRGAWSDEFHFTIRGDEWRGPHLELPRPGEEALVARRTRDGRIAVRRPDGTEFETGLGAESEPVADGLHLVFRSEHVPRSLLGRLPGGGHRPEPVKHRAPGNTDPALGRVEKQPPRRDDGPVTSPPGTPDPVSGPAADDWL